MVRLILGAAALLGSSAAMAQTTAVTSGGADSGRAPVSGAPSTPNASPNNKMICEHQEVLGSRLEGRRVCKPASQGAEDRRIEREAVDQIQTQRSCYGNGK